MLNSSFNEFHIRFDGSYLSLNSKLFDYIDTYDAFEKGMHYQVPVHFISGSEDWICPVELAREFEEGISAPQKDFTLIDGCGHSPHNAAPAEFDAAVRKVLEQLAR